MIDLPLNIKIIFIKIMFTCYFMRNFLNHLLTNQNIIILVFFMPLKNLIIAIFYSIQTEDIQFYIHRHFFQLYKSYFVLNIHL